MMIVFGFSIAGGSAEIINNLSPFLSLAGVQFIGIEYSGHGKRVREPLYSSIHEMTDDLYNSILSLLTVEDEYALFGYSMGCIALLEVLKRIDNNPAIKKPKHLIFAARALDTNMLKKCDWDKCSDENVKEYVIAFSGIPCDMIHNSFFSKAYLPIYRSDFKMISTYNIKQYCYTTQIPAEVLFSENDTPFSDISKWSKICKGDLSYHVYDGGHFFINSNLKLIANSITDCLD